MKTFNFDKVIQWENRLQTLREKSVAEINFIDALDSVITRDEYRSLTDDQQRELIQAWLYPTNDNGEIEKENCPNCADQASIAAPGQTTLCKTHDDERHYSEMRNFFDEQINDFHMTSFLPFCSRCGKDAPDHVIIMHDSKMNPFIFAACVDCRIELTLKQNAARAALERIGA